MVKEIKPITIKKIYKKKGNHKHGGNWKVAYADFVTAMMVFFLLMWLLATLSPDTLSEIKDYFGSEEFETKKYTSSTTNSKIESNSKNSINSQNRLISTIESQISNISINHKITVNKKENNIIVSLESNWSRPLFDAGNDSLTTHAKQSLNYLSKLLAQYNFPISIGVHNNSGEIKKSKSIFLSILRAQNTRNQIIAYGIPENTIIAITGYGDMQYKKNSRNEAIENRRIDIIIHVPNT